MHVPGAGAIAAACPSCAHPLAGVLVQEAPLRHPKSVAGAGADAPTGPPYLHFSSLLLGALVRLPKLVPVAGAIASACPSSAHPLAGILVQGDPLRHSKSVAGAGAMLLLALLTFTSGTCYSGPCCACRILFL